ncbi:MAG: outer membrane beta-barrel protein [Gemmatimonadaceae bacterium]
MHEYSSRLVRRASLAFAMCLAPSLMMAQAPRRAVSVGLGGGATVPVGEFADDVKPGGHVLGFLQYRPLVGPWAVRGEVMYSRASYTDDFLSDVGATLGDDLHSGVLYAGASALYAGGESPGMSPYLIGGLGLYRLTATLKDDSGSSLSRSENGVGFNGGAGLRFGGSMGFFLEARFHQFSITPEGESKSTSRMVPVSAGFSF